MEPEQPPPPEVSPAPTLPSPPERNIAITGVLLVLAGAVLLLREFLSFNLGSVLLLVFGIGFLLAYVFSKRTPGFLIPGGVLTGLGLGVLLEPAVVSRQGGGVILLCLALGFGIIWLFESHRVWAAVVGGLLAALGAYILLVQLPEFREVARYWPAILIALGIWVLVRRLRTAGGV